MYLSQAQFLELEKLLRVFFSLPYSTDLDGKDCEHLLRIVKGASGRLSRRKELFDIISEATGYSVKTLKKPPTAVRVDLQEQRFCDVEEVRRMRTEGGDTARKQGDLLLRYMKDRIATQMDACQIQHAYSAILLKHWNTARTHFSFRYWEEDFFAFVNNLNERNANDEMEWVIQDAGLHARDRLRQDASGQNVRLLRMHYKHNQIFTDHDIPADAVKIEFEARPASWDTLHEILYGGKKE